MSKTSPGFAAGRTMRRLASAVDVAMMGLFHHTPSERNLSLTSGSIWAQPRRFEMQSWRRLLRIMGLALAVWPFLGSNSNKNGTSEGSWQVLEVGRCQASTP